MSTNKRVNKAYVRYDKSGRIIPGSLILNRIDPKVGNWHEIPAYKCCNPSPVPPGPVDCTSFWINQIINPESANQLYGLGASMDSQCNSFLLSTSEWANPNNPTTPNYGNPFIQKFDNSGNLVWEKGFIYSEINTPDLQYLEPQTLGVDSNDNVIVTMIGGDTSDNSMLILAKFDNDGNHLWTKKVPNNQSEYTISELYVLSLVFDKSGNIYTCCTAGGSTPSVIQKFDGAGNLLLSKYIKFGPSTSAGFEPIINVNSNQEVYFYSRYSTDVHIIKLDSSFNVVWDKGFTGVSSTYGLVFDKDDNIIIQNGSGIYATLSTVNGVYAKISPSGTLIWANRINHVSDPNLHLGTFQMASDANGDVYALSLFPDVIPGYTPSDSYNTLTVAKLSTDGVFQWTYTIDATIGNMTNWFYWNPNSGYRVNNALAYGFYSNINQLRTQLVKLPLTPVTPGTYGNYVITDNTALWDEVPVSLTLTDKTSIYVDGGTTTIPLTYVEFAQASSITHINL